MSEAEQVAPKPATKMRLISPAGFLLALMSTVIVISGWVDV